MKVKKVIKIREGNSIPSIGLGVWQISDGKPVEQAVTWALEAGYRHIDTAHVYRNERGVGQAIRNSGLKREEIFITTKLFNTQHINPRKAIEGSLGKLGLDYIDLYLIHWPVSVFRNKTWGKLIEFKKEGLAKSIGVSNYTIRHLEELAKTSDEIPAVNQVEFHPLLYQEELLNYCRQHKIVLEAYSPLTHAERLDDGGINEIAEKYNKTNAQILIRWSLQLGNVVIPKSANKKRIAENINVFDFEISAHDMGALNLLNENLRTCWDPNGML